MNDLRSARYVRDYVVHLEFDDGLEGDVDLSSYLGRGPIFAPLADLSYFKQFSLEGGTSPGRTEQISPPSGSTK
jgi:hypothetical protein